VSRFLATNTQLPRNLAHAPKNPPHSSSQSPFSSPLTSPFPLLYRTFNFFAKTTVLLLGNYGGESAPEDELPELEGRVARGGVHELHMNWEEKGEGEEGDNNQVDETDGHGWDCHGWAEWP